MQLIPIEKIIIRPNRQRREFDVQMLTELGASIQAQQLLHAPVLREENGEFVLVAGETRIKAIQDLWMLGGNFKYNNLDVPEGMIPYVTMGQLSELEARNKRHQAMQWCTW